MVANRHTQHCLASGSGLCLVKRFNFCVVDCDHLFSLCCCRIPYYIIYIGICQGLSPPFLKKNTKKIGLSVFYCHSCHAKSAIGGVLSSKKGCLSKAKKLGVVQTKLASFSVYVLPKPPQSAPCFCRVICQILVLLCFCCFFSV